jgi:hypothetical protein
MTISTAYERLLRVTLRKETLYLVLCMLALSVAASADEDHHHHVITFNAPGAGTGPFQGTLAYSINPGGAITGLYVDASNVDHGFLRRRAAMSYPGLNATIRSRDFANCLGRVATTV